LSIDLVAQLSRFEADMKRAAGVVEQSAQRMERGFGGVKSVFAGSLLSSFANDAARAVVRMVPALVDGVAALQDLEDKTGASAEALARMVTPADVAGVSIDQVAGFMVKLTATLSKATAESKGAGAALKFLGLELDEFRGKAPDEQFRLLAERLDALPVSANRTAVAVALLGKSGAEALPFFKDLAEIGLTQNSLTKEQIRLADELTKRNERLRSELKQAAQVAALQMLPAINALTLEFTKATTEALGLDGALTKVGGNNAFRDWAQDSVVVIGDLVDAMSTLDGWVTKLNRGVPLSIKGANDGFKREASGLRDVVLAGEKALVLPPVLTRVLGFLGGATPQPAPTGIGDRLRARNAESNAVDAVPQSMRDTRGGPPPTATPPKPFVFNDPTNNATKALREAEQERKAILDAQLRALDAALGAERDRLQFHGDYLERVYQDGALSVREFYDERRAIEARGLQQQLATFKAEEEALRAFLAKTTDPSERARTQGRIDDIAAKSADAMQRYSQQAVLGYQAQASATQQATDRLREFQAQLLELEGDAAGAARLRADAAIEQARRSARSIGLPPDELASFERATRAAEELGNAQRNVQRITSDLAREEERVAIAAATSGASRQQVEQQLFALRSQALEQLRREVIAAESLAVGANPNSDAAQFAQTLRLEFERAASAVDPLRTRLFALADDVSERWSGVIEDALLDGDWQQAGETIMRDLTRGLLNETFTQPLQQALSSLFKGSIGTSGTGGAGLFASVFGDFFGLFGFSAGGFTGGLPVQAPAGVVHGQEYVFSAPAVRSLGVPMLEQLHRSARAGAPRLGLPGYADGGLVSAWRGGGGVAGVTPVVNMPVHIHNNAPGVRATTRRRSDGGMDVFIDEAERALGERIDSGFGLAKNISGRFALSDGSSLPR
jgi:hypothetical protein